MLFFKAPDNIHVAKKVFSLPTIQEATKYLQIFYSIDWSNEDMQLYSADTCFLMDCIHKNRC